MRKIITLTGFISLMIWLWLYAIWIAVSFYFSFSIIFFIAGIALMIIGAITKPKELKEPFRSIAEKFDKVDKFILMASIFLLLSALWLISYGVVNLIIHHYLPPVYSENITADDLNATMEKWLDNTFIEYKNTYLVFSYLAIFTGLAYIYVGITISQRKHSSILYPVIALGIVVAVILHMCNITILGYLTYHFCGILGLAAGSEFPSIFTIFIILFSIVSILLVILQKYMMMAEENTFR